MPIKAPRLCECGKTVQAGLRCACKAGADRDRKARFDATRPNSSGRGYNGAWDRARADYLKAHPYCVRCGQPAEHLDHVTPHKGDKGLFWDRTNWQGLCQYHHNSAKQREERRDMKGK